MKDYKTIIRESIERIIELHGNKDEYWKKVINTLVADLKHYEQQVLANNFRYTRSDFDKRWNRLLKQFFPEFFRG